MATYLIWTGVIFICLLIAERTMKYEYVSAIGTRKYLPSKFWTFIIFCILAGLYIFRWCNGTDFFNYYMGFYSSEDQNLDYIKINRDILFSLITYITRNFISDNFLLYNAILAVCTYAPVILIMRKYSVDFKMTILLYIFSTAYFQPYNTVRQAIAVAVLFGASSYLMRHQNFKFLICAVIAFLFHPTAAIVATIMIFCRSDFMSGKVKILLFLFAGSGIALKTIWSSVIDMLVTVGQTKMAADYADALTESTGINGFHVLVIAIPFMLVLIYKNNLLHNENSSENELNSFYMNCLLFYFGFVVIGMYNPVFTRMGQFFELFLLVLYPELIRKVFEAHKHLMVFLAVLAYFIYFLVVLPRGGNFVPYQFNYYSLKGIRMWL